jgi:hypothetical protein
MSRLKHTIDLDSDSSTPANGGNVIEKTRQKLTGLKPSPKSEATLLKEKIQARIKMWENPSSTPLTNPQDCSTHYIQSDLTKSTLDYQFFKTNPQKLSFGENLRESVFPGLIAAHPNLCWIQLTGAPEHPDLAEFNGDGQITPFYKKELMNSLCARGFTDVDQNEKIIKNFLASCVKFEVKSLAIQSLVSSDNTTNLYRRKLSRNSLQTHLPAYASFLATADTYNQCNKLQLSRPDSDRIRLFVGRLLDPEGSKKQSLVLLGEGDGGKSTFLEALYEFLGDEIACSFDFSSNTTRKESLIGRRLALVDDTNTTGASFFDSGFFKGLTGTKRHLVNPKNKTPHTAQIDASFIITTNKAPRLNNDQANKSRYFPIVITPLSAAQRAAFPGWDKQLVAETEDFIAQCYEFYCQEVAKDESLKKFIPPNTDLVDDAVSEDLGGNVYLPQVELHCVLDPGVKTPTATLYQAFGCKTQQEQTELTKALKSLGVEKKALTTTSSKKQQHFVGVRLKN